ncbi:MAG: adenine phosphoribosyltransferase [Colwellia sp.]
MNTEALTLEQTDQLKNAIITVPNYPHKGIMFRDITSLLEDPKAFALCIEILKAKYENRGFTKIIGTEARGFIFGAPLALALGIGFVPVRKPGKLPRETFSQAYQLEYGEDVLEIHQDALTPQDNVLIIDDLLATGGTIEATAELVRRAGAKADEAAFIISLPDLGGEERLKNMQVNNFALLKYNGE